MRPAPKWFLPVAIAALLWNLLGCAAYLMDVSMSADDIAALDAPQRALYATRPAWSVAATAFAVWGGALGCLALVLKRRWALPVLVVSLLGVLAQDAYLFGSAMTRSAVGPTAAVLQGVVLLVAIGLVWLASSARRRHWIG